MKKLLRAISCLSLALILMISPAAVYAENSTDNTQNTSSSNNTQNTSAVNNTENTSSSNNTQNTSESNSTQNSSASDNTQSSGSSSNKTSSTKIFKINSFTVEKKTDKRYQLSWKFSNNTADADVQLYLTTDTEDADADNILLAQTTSTGSGTLTVTLRDADPGYYHFMIVAETSTGATYTKYSDDAYFIENTKRAAALKNITFARNKNTVYVVNESGTDEIIIFIYDNDTKNLIASEKTTDKIYEKKIPGSHDDVLIGAAAISEGDIGQFTPEELLLSDVKDGVATFQETDITNEESINYSISDVDDYTLRVFENDEECEPSPVTYGEYSVKLTEGDNRLIVFAEDKSGRIQVSEKNIELDTVPPELYLYDMTDSFKTNDEVIFVKGKTEEDSVITCDNTETELVGDCFCAEKQLIYGINTFEIKAQDKAGNTTVITMNVNRSFWDRDHINMIYLIVAGVFIAMADIIYLLYRRSRKKKKERKQS